MINDIEKTLELDSPSQNQQQQKLNFLKSGIKESISLPFYINKNEYDRTIKQ